MQAEFSEHAVFDVFKKMWETIPAGTITHVDKPDFLIHGQGRVYGYEITQLYHLDPQGKPTSIRHGQCDKIMEKAKRICIEDGLGPLYVSVFFSFNSNIPKSDWPGYAESLASIVKMRAPSIGGTGEWENEYGGPVPDEIESVLIFNNGPDGRHFWTHGGVGIGQVDISHQLQEAINKKSLRLPTYLNKCDECSLIVAAGGLPGVSAMMPSAENLSRSYSSLFKETFFVRILDSQCHQLKTTPGL